MSQRPQVERTSPCFPSTFTRELCLSSTSTGVLCLLYGPGGPGYTWSCLLSSPSVFEMTVILVLESTGRPCIPGPSIVTLSCHPRSINSHPVMSSPVHQYSPCHSPSPVRHHPNPRSNSGRGQTLVSQLSSVNPALAINLNTLLLFLLCKYYSVRFY